MTSLHDTQSSGPVTPELVNRAAPPSPMGSGDYSHFVWVQLSELQKSVGEVNSNCSNLKSSMDSVKSKVDDLVAWRNRIFGGCLAASVTLTWIGYLVIKLSDHISLTLK
jgi:hypothetical protein